MEVAPVPCLVEGVLDEAVVRKMLVVSSLDAASFYLESLPAFRTKLKAFNQAARHRPWFALCDLDHDECAPARVRDFLSDPASGMCFRIAERTVEAWLLADRASIARFLSVSGDLVNADPERLPAPKSHLVSLARRSRSRAVREGLVPAEGDSRRVGPEYTLLMSEYARERWNPLRAADRSPSLQRAMVCLRTLLRVAAGSDGGRTLKRIKADVDFIEGSGDTAAVVLMRKVSKGVGRSPVGACGF